MASVLAKIQTLEREKTDLSNQLSSTNSALTKYREEKSVGMKDKYIKEMKDFIDGLQLKDPEVKNLMHARYICFFQIFRSSSLALLLSA